MLYLRRYLRMIEYSMEVSIVLSYFRTQTYMHALFCIVDYLRTRYDTVQYSIFEGTTFYVYIQQYTFTSLLLLLHVQYV